MPENEPWTEDPPELWSRGKSIARAEFDESELATVLAALRLFQRTYDSVDSETIAAEWDHFNKEEGIIPPLGSEDIDDLCERINCSTGQCVTVITPIGHLRANTHDDPTYPGLTIYWNERQIAVIERIPNTSIMRVMVWDNDNESPTITAPVFPGYGE